MICHTPSGELIRVRCGGIPKKGIQILALTGYVDPIEIVRATRARERRCAGTEGLKIGRRIRSHVNLLPLTGCVDQPIVTVGVNIRRVVCLSKSASELLDNRRLGGIKTNDLSLFTVCIQVIIQHVETHSVDWIVRIICSKIGAELSICSCSDIDAVESRHAARVLLYKIATGIARKRTCRSGTGSCNDDGAAGGSLRGDCTGIWRGCWRDGCCDGSVGLRVSDLDCSCCRA